MNAIELQEYIGQCLEPYMIVRPCAESYALVNKAIDKTVNCPDTKPIRACALLGLEILHHLSQGGGFQLTDPPETTDGS